MTEIIFVKSTHVYESYLDYWKLVELCGFSTVYENEIDITNDVVYIVSPMNGNYIEHMAGNVEKYQKTGEISGGQIFNQPRIGIPRQAHIIIWNLERPSGSGSTGEHARQCHKWMNTRLADEVWVSDFVLADETQTRYVALGSHPGLGELSEEKTYDFCHMSVEIPRRTAIYSGFDKEQIGQNCWPPERDEVLKRSKFALNVHQDNYPYCEPLRFALFAAYGLPVISEVLVSHYNSYYDIVTFAYHDLVAGLKTALANDYDQWKKRGLGLHQTLCYDMQFGDMVRKALGESVGIGWR